MEIKLFFSVTLFNNLKRVKFKYWILKLNMSFQSPSVREMLIMVMLLMSVMLTAQHSLTRSVPNVPPAPASCTIIIVSFQSPPLWFFNLHFPLWPLLMYLFHMSSFSHVSSATLATHTHPTHTHHLPTGAEFRSLEIFLFSSTHSRFVRCQLSHYQR